MSIITKLDILYYNLLLALTANSGVELAGGGATYSGTRQTRLSRATWVSVGSLGTTHTCGSTLARGSLGGEEEEGEGHSLSWESWRHLTSY